MNLIEVRKLCFSYRIGDVDVPIFDDFDLSIKKGEFVAIKGPSGSGKSTLLYLLAGLLQQKSGDVFIKGQNLTELSDLELSALRNKSIGFVFQQFHLLPKANAMENILMPTLYPIEERKRDRDVQRKAKDLADELGIGDRLDHFSNQLSGGQQQRVAIARALINDPDIILADEPTGNLDSKSTEQIIGVLKHLHHRGKTIVLITHEDEVAQAASTIYQFRDGKVVEQKGEAGHSQDSLQESEPEVTSPEVGFFSQYLKIVPLVLANAFRNKTRSFLTMVGITVGVAAVCAMVTLGNFTKEKILDTYAELGVNTIIFRGYPNWELKATDKFPVKFNFFDWDKELIPLKTIIPDIELISPNMNSWNASVSYGGKTVDREPRLIGVSQDGLKILNRRVIAGKGISQFHVEGRAFVCVVGYEIGERLFPNISPLGQIVHVSQNNSTFACKVIGVLEPKTSNKEWSKPNLQVFVPFTTFQSVGDNWWNSQITKVTMQLHPASSVEQVGSAVRGFFEMKYGKSGSFRVDSDSLLIAQMEKFLNLFSVMLITIALISLTVGGMGIANMMLVSVSERLKEIGLRKSVGATHTSIRNQFLMESLILCMIAGILGIFFGVAAYQGAIYGAARLIDKLEYQWVIEPSAILLSLVSIVTVGLLSGLVPAIKAEKLQVIDALRSE